MVNIFTYGSLMFDPVWSRVVAGSYDRCEAILQGYDRKGVGEKYTLSLSVLDPLKVQGIIYFDVSPSDLARLDQFEGEYYFRKTAQVVTLEMAAVPAEIYVLKEEYYTIISNTEWDAAHFSTTGIHYFINSHIKTGEQ